MQEACRPYPCRLREDQLDLEKDPRDFLVEAEEELLDTINYLAFEVVKIRPKQAYVPRIRSDKACGEYAPKENPQRAVEKK